MCFLFIDNESSKIMFLDAAWIKLCSFFVNMLRKTEIYIFFMCEKLT